MDEPGSAIGFIGAGAMARFLADGMVAAGLPPESVWVCNRGDAARLRPFAAAGMRVGRDKAEVCAHAGMLLLLVKPKDADTALRELAPLLRPEHLVVSCMAGVPTTFVEEALGPWARVLRAMPNIGASAGASVTALAAGRHARAADVDRVTRLLEAVGMVAEVEEAALDAVTAVCGSGPAYVFLLMEALEEAAAEVGLRGPLARRMVVQTVLGAGRVAAGADRGPQELRAEVASPGGTTEAALEVLEAAGFRRAVRAAVERAAARSRELGERWAGVPARPEDTGVRP